MQHLQRFCHKIKLALHREWGQMKIILSFHYSECSRSTFSSSSKLEKRKRKELVCIQRKKITLSAQVVFILSIKHRLTSAFRHVCGIYRWDDWAFRLSYTVGAKACCQNVCRTSCASCALSGQYNLLTEPWGYSHVRFIAFILMTFPAWHHALNTVPSGLEALHGRPWESCGKIVQPTSHTAHWLKHGTWW